MKNTTTLLILAGLLTTSASLYAASHAGAPMTKNETTNETKDEVKKGLPAVATADMADGEVRKVDKENRKITLKHGVIKSLDMPGMTMVFQVKDAAMLDKLKAGDKVKFKAEQAGSAIVLTEIQLAK
jgi:Cu(I)/Ag(I) efflux system periplasmic protein CusF